jgi:hypothetical protein
MTRFALVLCAALAAAACAGPGAPRVAGPVTIEPVAPNAVTFWDEVATATVNQPGAASGTPAERLPLNATDLATVHLAIYDAVIAIAGTHRPYAVTPRVPVAGASPDAAAAAAAYGVLKGLFPGRGAAYEGAYRSFVAALPDDRARALGLAVGADVAAGMLAARADDGRGVTLPPYVPGSEPGQFRGASPVNRVAPHVKPFVVHSHAQFRAGPPPSLTSAAYAADLAETQALGGATSRTRSADQTELARFHTEPPPAFWPRNLRRLAMTPRPLAEQARLMAMLWAAQADAIGTCFESKYHYNAWRPLSALPGWTPVVPTPNHPEYPAAHSCVAGATAAVLRAHFGTDALRFAFDSAVTGTTRRFASARDMTDELALARIAGGMHLRSSTVAGTRLGEQVGQWVATRAFLPLAPAR